MQAMQVLQSQYDGADRVSDYIEKLIRYLATDNPPKSSNTHTSYMERRSIGENNSVVDSPSSAISEKSGPTINDWSDVFLRRTHCYLRIVMTVDLSFSKGEFPEESDFPSSLYSSNLSAILPLYRMDLGIFQRKISGVPSYPQVNGEQVKGKDSSATDGNNMTLYNLTHYQSGSQPDTANMLSLGNYDSMAPGGFESAFSSQMEFMDPKTGEQASRDFNLDSWIYDVLPTFT